MEHAFGHVENVVAQEFSPERPAAHRKRTAGREDLLQPVITAVGEHLARTPIVIETETHRVPTHERGGDDVDLQGDRLHEKRLGRIASEHVIAVKERDELTDRNTGARATGLVETSISLVTHQRGVADPLDELVNHRDCLGRVGAVVDDDCLKVGLAERLTFDRRKALGEQRWIDVVHRNDDRDLRAAG